MRPLRPSRRATLAWTAASLAALAYYLSWLLQPGNVGVLPLFIALVAADLFNGFHALSFWVTSLRGPRRRQLGPVGDRRVDVFIPTYNEPVTLLGRTVRAACELDGAEVRVFVLDDGNRHEVEVMAHRLGAGYIARRDNRGAKAGNINNALAATEGAGAPFVCVFDADHVPRPGFVERTLGHFADPAVGLVQTPQIYANAGQGPLTRGAAEQQAIFFGPICAGRDGFESSFCTGTNFVARRDLLKQAGGFPEDSITEDIVLSTKLTGLGAEIVYVGEPLSTGLGPEDGRSYVSQQLRWATGCLDLLLRRPHLWRPLSWTQRWQYLVATSYWLTGWTFFIYALLPILRLAFGWQPVGQSAGQFAAHFMPYFLLSIINLGRFTAGGYTLAGLAMNWGSFAIHIRATLRVLLGRAQGFAVTSKRALAGAGLLAMWPNLILTGTILIAVVYGIVRDPSPATFNNVMFALIDMTLFSSIAVFAVGQARRQRRQARELEAVPSFAAETRVELDQPDAARREASL